MAKELQKIGFATSRALCEANAVPREPVLNDGTGDAFGPEIIVSDDAGTTFFHFPSTESGLLGGGGGKLSEVSTESLTTADQTFIIKTETDLVMQSEENNHKLLFQGSSGDLMAIQCETALNLIAQDDLGIYAHNGGDVNIQPTSGAINALRKLNTVASASTSSGLNIPHGTAPSSPANGDMWTTTAGLFVRINGTVRQVTVT